MPQQIIAALLEKGWTYDVIAAKTGISAARLRAGKIKQRELDELYRLAELEAGIDIDNLKGE